MSALVRLFSAIVDKVSATEPPVYRPSLPLDEFGIYPDLVTTMKLCWDEQPQERPSFDDVMKTLIHINHGKYV